MPVGVPKIPYRLPGEEDATWVDLYNVMYRDRSLFLIQELQDEIANQIMGIMTYINLEEDEKTPVNLYINSPGGSLFAGLGIYDTMKFIKPPVYTLCMGIAASMASVVLMGGEITQRLLFPNARVMIHQPATAYYDGQAGECAIEAGEILRLRDQVTQLYRQHSGKLPSELCYDLERDFFLSSEEAIAYGIADGIAEEMKVPSYPLYDPFLDEMFNPSIDQISDPLVSSGNGSLK
jgi:ATP-dependent Clp protease protease subunit